MNREKTFRNRFDMRLHRLQDAAERFETALKEQTTTLADQTREGWKRGQRKVEDWEDQVERSVKKNPLLFLGGALGLIGLLIAKMLFDRRHGIK